MKDTFKAALRRASCAAMLGTPILAGCATGGGGALPEQIVLGRDANDEPCRADRSFKDADQGPFEYDYAIGCRGVTASRTVGAVSRVPVSDARREESAACGAASTVPVAGIGPVEARRCFDTALNAETIVVEFQDDGYRYRGSAVPAVVGPMEQALRVIARGARPPQQKPRPLRWRSPIWRRHQRRKPALPPRLRSTRRTCSSRASRSTARAATSTPPAS